MAVDSSAHHMSAISSITVVTSQLKSSLNRIYESACSHMCGKPKYFYELWDIKERALMKGENTVDVPRSWLDEVEKYHSTEK